MKHVFTTVALLVLLLNTNTVQAADEPRKLGIIAGMTSGLIMPILPDTGTLYGVYLYAGPSIALLPNDNWAVVFGLGFRTAAHIGNYGASLSIGGSYMLNEALSFDFGASASFEDDPSLKETLGRSLTGYISPAIGVSLYLPGCTSVGFSAAFDISVDGIGAAITPTILLTVPFWNNVPACGGTT